MKRNYHIQLGNELFIFDPIAEKLLENYLNTLHNFYQKKENGDRELMNIEKRMAQFLNERLADRTMKIVSQEDIESSINMIGSIEELCTEIPNNTSCDEESLLSIPSSSPEDTSYKRLYRDPEHRLIGGIASGLSQYLNIDVVWIRLILIITLLMFCGITFWAYVIAWIIIPMARTPKDQTKMKGHSKKESNTTNEKHESVSPAKEHNKTLRKQIKQSAYRSGNVISPIMTQIIRVIGVILSVAILMFSLILFLLINYFFFFMNTLPWNIFLEGWNYLWIYVIINMFVLSPFIFLSYLSLRFLTDSKYKLWIVILLICLSLIGLIGITVSFFKNETNFNTRIESYISTSLPTHTISVIPITLSSSFIKYGL